METVRAASPQKNHGNHSDAAIWPCLPAGGASRHFPIARMERLAPPLLGQKCYEPRSAWEALSDALPRKLTGTTTVIQDRKTWKLTWQRGGKPNFFGRVLRSYIRIVLHKTEIAMTSGETQWNSGVKTPCHVKFASGGRLR